METGGARAELLQLCAADHDGQELEVAALDLLDDYEEDLEESSSWVDCSDVELPLIHEEVENFCLQSGAATVSITQLQMCINDDEEVVYEKQSLQDVYLVGQTTCGSKEISVLAEKWKLILHSDYPPGFLVKTAIGWVRLRKPKSGYRRIMNDGLTLAYFIHYLRKHPSQSAKATKDYLANEFGKLGEKPSLEKLSEYFPVIRKYLEIDMQVEMASVLREFFPHHFDDVVATYTVKEISEEILQERKLIHSGINIDLKQEILDDIQDHGKQGMESTSSLKARKPRRISVQAELRNLHSQWCSLIAGRAAGKEAKKTVSKKSGPTARRSPASKRRRPSEDQKDVSKKRPIKSEHENPTSKKCHSSVHHQPELTSVSSLESKTTALKQQNVSKPVLTVPKKEAPKKEAQKSKVKAANHRRGKGLNKQLPSNSGNGARGPLVGRCVHSPSKGRFDGLEDPPICAICDDGGDLIWCEGPCGRHFHARRGANSGCHTLGLTSKQLREMEIFYCKNCLMGQHQCFVCEELGSSTSSSLGCQQVYMCDAPGCRKFYHAGCVAKVLDPVHDWRAVADRIERGLHGFLCPCHSCAVCTSKEIRPGTFVQCRRCPKAWHKECLTDYSFSGERPKTTIWNQHDREFIYCKAHKILPNIQTPKRDHLRFPE